MSLRDSFPEFYPLSTQDAQGIWKTALIVPDANVLLELYEVSPPARKNLQDLMKKLQARLWFPHQILSEYLTNRRQVIRRTAEAYTKKLKQLKDNRTDIAALNEERKLPYLDAAKGLKAATNAIDAVIAALEAELEGLAKPDLDSAKDSILAFVEGLTEGRTGAPLTIEALQSEVSKAQGRVDLRLPPGFEDADKGPLGAAGDALWWNATVEKAKAEAKPIIILSNDAKRDWVVKDNGTVLGLHPLLRREMRERSKQEVLILDSDDFYRQGSKFLKQQADEATLKELEAKRAAEAAAAAARLGTIQQQLANPELMENMRRFAEIQRTLEGGVYHDILAATRAIDNSGLAALRASMLNTPRIDLASLIPKYDFDSILGVDRIRAAIRGIVGTTMSTDDAQKLRGDANLKSDEPEADEKPEG